MGIIRKTKSVETILQLFEQSSNAISVVDLVEQFKGKANKSTIYRILERLESEGLVHSFRGQDGLTWYAKCHDCSTDHHIDLHPHFQCNNCGKVECLSVSVQVPVVPNKSIDKAQILLLGQCEHCISENDA